MPDDYGGNGGMVRAFGAAGQRTSEVTGRDENAVMHEHLHSLWLRRAMEVAFWPAAALLIGPATLPVLAAAAVRPVLAAIANWQGQAKPKEDKHGNVPLTDKGEPVLGWRYLDRDDFEWSWDVVAFAFAAGVLLALPDGPLLWWPIPWQTRANWYGLWYAIPEFDRVWAWLRGALVLAATALRPGWLLVRLTLVAAVLRAWPETRHADNRDRQEIEVPTMSGAAYAQARVEDVEIENWVNPHRQPVIDVTPRRPETRPDIPFRGKARLVPDALTEDGNGHDEPVTRTFRKSPPPTLSATAQSVKMIPDTPTVVDFPVGLFVMPTEAERWAAELLASGSRKVSANAMHPHYCSEPRSREVRDWLEARNYAERANARLWLLTDDGVELLRHVAAGRWREWREEAVEA